MGDDHKSERHAEWGAWMAAAQDGDQAAYARLLRDVLPFLRAIAARRHRTADRVEDVVQDVLLTVHRVRHTYDPARPFAHWLATIAERRSIDALPPGQREAIELVKLRELSLEEASAVSGKSVAALKVNVHRALKALRLRLTGER